jgi:hypothetical protein
MTALTHPSQDEAPLGHHEGIKILEQQIVINKTGDGLSKAVGIDPTVIETDSERNLVVRIKHRKRTFKNVYSKPDKESEEPPVLKGVIQIDHFDALGSAFDDRSGTEQILTRTISQVADYEERIRAERANQFRLPNINPLGDEGEDAEIIGMDGSPQTDG